MFCGTGVDNFSPGARFLSLGAVDTETRSSFVGAGRPTCASQGLQRCPWPHPPDARTAPHAGVTATDLEDGLAHISIFTSHLPHAPGFRGTPLGYFQINEFWPWASTSFVPSARDTLPFLLCL